ncbi:glyoxalase superfamily protein [Deinococcus soli (ex Cha et al. 2016)]|uniref:Uncharacterized protein n=2 Tax=Deinococcus soli (ex Cha et al. 2016) TaxID=1309411 RepID=A0ACC6KHB1_9DEIO|nr:glyoxalase superfamily protein [Deinococcus soli (ex Cha et al. 2016)]MDR6218872.1 hypothetical protein [Deinococcus soli (ex Cha et al. 2016)]MDR6328669.1 hypothetical protein [Deinococcus soli (ex Cha et al. 2016)]MDR6751844.1 hypothetical protein [Deinococcus soli (ex Cha et al. 2016)]
MERPDLKQQARRLRLALQETPAQQVTPARALHLTARMHGYPNWQAAKALSVRPAQRTTVYLLWSYGGDVWFYSGSGQLLNFFYNDELSNANEACQLIRRAVHAACGQDTTFIHKNARVLTDLAGEDGGEFEQWGESEILDVFLARRGVEWIASLPPEPDTHRAPLYTGEGDPLCTPSSVTP